MKTPFFSYFLQKCVWCGFFEPFSRDNYKKKLPKRAVRRAKNIGNFVPSLPTVVLSNVSCISFRRIISNKLFEVSSCDNCTVVRVQQVWRGDFVER